MVNGTRTLPTSHQLSCLRKIRYNFVMKLLSNALKVGKYISILSESNDMYRTICESLS